MMVILTYIIWLKLAHRIYKVLSNTYIYLFFTRMSWGGNYCVRFASEKTEKLPGFSFLHWFAKREHSLQFMNENKENKKSMIH